MSRIALLQATFADVAEAERIGRAVVEERLAACANLLAPCTSIYRWQGAVETASEVPALFKTRPDLVERLAARIAALHGYELPVIEWWSAEASAAVVDWIARETG
ncbi:divalent-cation tolerance protein CutA [Sphingomonas sp. ACRSK]|uniref:divalent-cation tolerance protein CutA n=1 Tax=Sphingomonas sp. ACRSK TaxID=2918213 RepID=UPI001EF63551|nr:divalent-cation tolerance protein CutA [Sphingomonas sp. ACRSK]MCG7346867.1 divalent-cation tolerance protein CutA [Sphingomonas sp. ACRSK]